MLTPSPLCLQILSLGLDKALKHIVLDLKKKEERRPCPEQIIPLGFLVFKICEVDHFLPHLKIPQ